MTSWTRTLVASHLTIAGLVAFGLTDAWATAERSQPTNASNQRSDSATRTASLDVPIDLAREAGQHDGPNRESDDSANADADDKQRRDEDVAEVDERQEEELQETDSEHEADEDEDDGGEDDGGEEAKDEKAEDDDEDENDQEDSKEVEFKGHFVANESAPVSRRPEEWGKMRILSAVDHGTKVRRGDVLIELETRELDLAIESLEHDISLGKISLEQAEQSLQLLQKSTPLALELAERNERHNVENLKRFLTIDKTATKESIEFSLQNSENYLAYQEEELKQLERMYQADDLTEETEEIILKRTRDRVASAQFAAERARRSHDRGLEVDLPRRQEELENAVQQATIELERARNTLPAKIAQERLNLEKLKLTQKKMENRLLRLRNDRGEMTIKAPTAGIVYYGDCRDGKCPKALTLAATLRPGNSLKPNQPIMTIVQTRPIYVKATLAEKHLRHAQPDTQVTVVPTALPDTELTAEIESVSVIPVGDGQFAATIRVDLSGETERIVPGMSCTVKIETEPEDDDKDEDKDDSHGQDEDASEGHHHDADDSDDE